MSPTTKWIKPNQDNSEMIGAFPKLHNWKAVVLSYEHGLSRLVVKLIPFAEKPRRPQENWYGDWHHYQSTDNWFLICYLCKWLQMKPYWTIDELSVRESDQETFVLKDCVHHIEIECENIRIMDKEEASTWLSCDL